MEVIAMATVDRELAAEGQKLEVALPSGGTAGATVGTFPLYDPEKKRPRS
jgi:glycine cleavage system aminomethyltransferase T